jgi:phosphoribosylformylglycinamidine cyclo-ligase
MSLGVEEGQMFNTFNMGIGFVLCVDKDDEYKVLKTLADLGEKAYSIGYVEAGGAGLCLK